MLKTFAALWLVTCSCSGWAGDGQIAGRVVGPEGTPLSRAWVMTCSGRLTQTKADGTFVLTGLSDGGYALKAVAPGMEDALLARLAVTSGAPVTCRLQMKGSESAVVSGQVTDAVTGKQIAAWFEIRSGSAPVRWFDAAGRPYGGRTDVPPEVWHQKNSRYWTSGEFAFSAVPGEVRLVAKADGYASARVERKVAPSSEERFDIALRPLFNSAAAGWFKGDFHAHGVHGEKLYDVNIPEIAFILRAERYHWFNLSSGFNNDGVRVDAASVAGLESGPDLQLFLNSEYPKTGGGHVGTVGVGPPAKPLPYPRYANVEAIKADIADQGGAAVPVHPLYGHMRSKELPFILLGAPELICGFDFYTSWNAASEKTWALFLNQGYRLCRTATSDAAFDLGRTPGTVGATYIHPAGGRLSREGIVEALKSGRTTLSWEGALLLFTIDGAACGTTFASAEKGRSAVLALHDAPGERRVITVTRNGDVYKRFPVTVPESGLAEVTFTLAEREKAWYAATCGPDGKPERVVAASSPFYFGDWSAPAPVLARVDVKVLDAETKAPLEAQIDVCDVRQTLRTLRTRQGTLRVEARAFERIRARAEGYADAETGVLGVPTIKAFIDSLSEDDLQTWTTYEKAKSLLQTAELTFFMKRK